MARRGAQALAPWPRPRSAAPPACGLRLRRGRRGRRAQLGIARFSTTLTVSPYQRHDLIARGRRGGGRASTASTSSTSTCATQFRDSYAESRRLGPLPPAATAAAWPASGRPGTSAARRRRAGVSRVTATASRSADLDYELPPELIAQTPGGTARRVAPAGVRRAAGALRGPRVPRAAGAAARRRRAGAQRHARVPGAHALPARHRRAHRGAVPASRRWPAAAATARRALGGAAARPAAAQARCSSSEARWGRAGRCAASSRWATGAGSCAASAPRPVLELLARAGVTPLPPYINGAAGATPSATRRRYARVLGLGGGADGRPALHAGARRGARAPPASTVET